MEANRKRRLLAALEGQLERWRRQPKDESRRQRVLVLLKQLQAQEGESGDGDYPRRVARRLAGLTALRGDALAFSASVTLVRMDCLLWQVSLAHFRPRVASAA